MLLLEKLSWGWVPNNVWHKNLSVEIYDRLCRCDNRFLASPSALSCGGNFIIRE